MTNPFPHGSTGYNPDSSLPALGQRRSSYASVASGSNSAAAHPARSSNFSHLLNPASDGGPDMRPSNGFRPRSHDAGLARNGSPANGSGGSVFSPARSLQLQGHSRAFETLMSREPLLDGGAGGSTRFLSPSYLKGTTYLKNLEEAHRAKMAQREGQQGQAQSGSGGLSSSASMHSLSGSKLAQASHRGMAYDVVEKQQHQPPLADADGLTPLPSKWNKDDKYGALEVLVDGLEVKHSGPRISSDRDHEAYCIRADHHMPPQCGIYYFEVTIVNRKGQETTAIGVGFSSKSVALSRAPGWEPESWGYHGDDGHSFASQSSGKSYGPTFGTGDTIGCGVNFNSGCAFFTKNGFLLGTAFRDVKGKLYPTVGLRKSGDHVLVNFGHLPFQYDIDQMMKDEKDRINKAIASTSTAKLAPPLDETELVQQLVLQFLQHDGYVETARAFAEEIHSEKKALNLDPDAEIEGINIRDDEDANNRQRIRRAILEGDIDKALKLTGAYYPQVLKDNEQVYFRLRCLKFIEMIRKDAEIKQLLEKKSSGQQMHDGQAMELDDAANWEQMEGEGGAGPDLGVGKLLQEALEYGQELREEFSEDPRREVQKYLEEIFALIAYPHPLKEERVAHLLDRSGRMAVAEELNSAILLSLGKSSRAALETVYAQTSVLLEDLRQGGGPGSFITLEGIVNEIPRPYPL